MINKFIPLVITLAVIKLKERKLWQSYNHVEREDLHRQLDELYQRLEFQLKPLMKMEGDK